MAGTIPWGNRRTTKVPQKITQQPSEPKTSSTSSGSTTLLPPVFGLPPDALLPETDRKQRDSMPICHFIPSQPSFKLGVDLFHITPAWRTSSNSDPSYLQLLESHGLTTTNNAAHGIQVAYLADNFPTDTFSNEYGENFLQSMTDVASSGASQISQFFGKKSLTEALGAAGNVLKGFLPEEIAGVDIKGNLEKFGSGAKDLATKLLNATGTTNAVGMVNRLLTGARLDFPMIWKSSGFQPSYSLTVRLYNPNPRSMESTKTYIVGPIIALLLLGVPITQDGSTYSWPYLHKVISPGIFELNPGFISNITVIKGGDQQQISQQQFLAMADVRIDVGSLFSSMVAGTTRIGQKSRPTIRKYMDNMLQQGTTSPTRAIPFDRKGQRLGDEAYKFVKETDSLIRSKGHPNTFSRNKVENPQPSQQQPQTEQPSTTTPVPRVLTNREAQAADLAARTPEGYGFRATDEEQ